MHSLKKWIKKNETFKRAALCAYRVLGPLAPPHMLRGMVNYLWFLADLRRFKRMGGKADFLDWYPCLFDKTATTGFDAQYLYQAAWGARKIFEAAPEQHVDVGSHLGFVTQLAAFTRVEFIDIRPAEINLKNFGVRKGSITALPVEDGSIESISSMHVIEHIGLGRYGDPIQSDGPQVACREIARVLKPGGKAYISVPIGRPRVGFNGLYVFDAVEFASYFPACKVVAFSCVDADGTFRQDIDHRSAKIDESRSGGDFGLGIYVLQKDQN